MSDQEKLELAREIYLAYMIETAEAKGDKLADGQSAKCLSGDLDGQHGVKIALRAIEALA